MNKEFFQKIEERYSDRNFKEKWEDKCSNFIDNFSYLNSEELIEDQIKKLTHVGIRSISESSSLIQKLTSENLDIMQNQLSDIIKDMNTLNNQFDLLEKSIKARPGIFSKKNSNQIFFETFKKEEKNIRSQINELKLKGHSLEEIKQNLEQSVNQLIDSYTLLERDIKFLKKADESFSTSLKNSVVEIYNNNLFEITDIRGEILTHQQIIFQKFAGIQILMENVLNCQKNINYISRITYSAVMNVVELQQILTFGQSSLDESQKNSFSKAKEALLCVTDELKTITSKPFIAHGN